MRSCKPGRAFLILLILTLMIGQVVAVPPLPAEFYGSIMINGTPSPAGTEVNALINGAIKGSIKTEISGFYGGPGVFDSRLKVFITEEEYQAGLLKVTFKINGSSADQTSLYEPGTSRQLDLTVTASVNKTEPETPDEFGANNTTPTKTPEPTPTVTPSPTLTPSHTLSQPKIFNSDDGAAQVFFPKEAMLFSPSGQFLQEISLRSKAPAEVPKSPKEGLLIPAGYAYEILPGGTYFNPQGTLSVTLPKDQADSIIKEKPIFYEYIEKALTWEVLKTDINQTSGKLSADVYEAGLYALFLTNGTEDLTQPPLVLPIQQVTDQSGVTKTLSETLETPFPTPMQTILEDTPQSSSSVDIQNISSVSSVPGKIPQSVNIGSDFFAPVKGIFKPVLSIGSKVMDIRSKILLKALSPVYILKKTAQLAAAIKARISKQVIIGISVILSIALVNLIIYSVYVKWWLARGRRNG